MSDPAILDKMSRMNWHHGPSDAAAQERLENRITESARRKSQLFYSELVQGIAFSVGGPTGVRDHVIDEWPDFDRALMGDHLGHLNYRWYERVGILPASIVVRKDQGTRGPGTSTSFERSAC